MNSVRTKKPKRVEAVAAWSIEAHGKLEDSADSRSVNRPPLEHGETLVKVRVLRESDYRAMRFALSCARVVVRDVGGEPDTVERLIALDKALRVVGA
jgi:hypothetical protein